MWFFKNFSLTLSRAGSHRGVPSKNYGTDKKLSESRKITQQSLCPYQSDKFGNLPENSEKYQCWLNKKRSSSISDRKISKFDGKFRKHGWWLNKVLRLNLAKNGTCKFVPRNSEICTPKFWFPKGKFFQLWVFHCFHGFVERNLYSWNVAMIIWSANKAGYIIPGLWSTVDSSHNAVAAPSLSHNETGFSFSRKTLWTSKRTSCFISKHLFCSNYLSGLTFRW